MLYKKIFIILFLISTLPLFLYAETNPKWYPAQINMLPLTPTEGDSITFRAIFRVAKGPVDNLLVEGRVDGVQVWSNTYPHLDKSQDVQVAFQWTAVAGNHTVIMEIDPGNSIVEAIENDNTVQKSFTVQGSGGNTGPIIATIATMTARALIINKPDLKMSLVFTPESPAVGQNTAIKAVVENIGKETSVETKMYIQIGSESSPPEFTVPALVPGRHYSITRKWNPPGPGWALWTAEVDKDGLIAEEHENNNKISKKMIIRGPDLAITEISTPDHTRILGQKCIIRGTVKNIGTADSGPFDIDAHFDHCWGIAEGRHWIRVDKGLKQGESYKFEFSHRFGCYGNKYAKITVDKNNEVKELDETNNEDGRSFNISAGNIIPD